MVSPLCPQVIYFGTIATRVVGDAPDAVITLVVLIANGSPDLSTDV